MKEKKQRMAQTINMTEGNPVKLLVIFSVPMMIGNIVQQLYNVVDSVIVGKLVSADALAAIGVTGSITFLFFALCNGLGSAGGIIVSQAFGQGDENKVKSCIANTAYIMLVFPGIVGCTAFVMAKPLLILLETPESFMADALIYTRLMCVGLVLISMYNFVSSVLRALGDSVTPLIFLAFSCIINAILDFVFVYFLQLAVVGAGVATVISQFLSAVLCLTYAFKLNYYFRLKKSDWKFRPELFHQIIRLGVPLSLQFSLIAISCMALQRVVNTFGETAAAAFTTTSRIEQVIHQPYQTLGAALSTYSGQNYGAKKNDRVILGYKKSMMMMMTIFTLCMIPVMQLFGRTITGFFVNEAEVIEMGAKALQISSLFYIFLGVIYVVRGVLNGLGDAFFAFLNGIVEVIGRVAVPILLTAIPTIGLWGIWWSVGIVWLMSGFAAWLRFIYYKQAKFTKSV